MISTSPTSPPADRPRNGHVKLRASQVGPAVATPPPRPRACMCSHSADGHFSRGTGPCKTKGCVCPSYRPWRDSAASRQ